MAMVEDSKLHDLVRKLLESFSPIHAAWRIETSQTTGNTADTILHDDILALGLYISAHDQLAANVERQMLAELLSFFETSLSQMPYEYILQTMDTQVAQMSASFGSDKPLPDFASLGITTSWASKEAARKAKAQEYVNFFSQLANEFVLRDGRVTDAEIKFLNDFDQRFKIP